MNEITETLTPEQAAILAQVPFETSEGEAAPEETTVFVTEDTADHTVH